MEIHNRKNGEILIQRFISKTSLVCAHMSAHVHVCATTYVGFAALVLTIPYIDFVYLIGNSMSSDVCWISRSCVDNSIYHFVYLIGNFISYDVCWICPSCVDNSKIGFAETYNSSRLKRRAPLSLSGDLETTGFNNEEAYGLARFLATPSPKNNERTKNIVEHVLGMSLQNVF